MDDGLVPFGRQFGKPVGRPSGDMHDWLPGPAVRHCHVLPGNAHPEPGSERLGAGLLRGPALCISACRVLSPLSLGPVRFR